MRTGDWCDVSTGGCEDGREGTLGMEVRLQCRGDDGVSRARGLPCTTSHLSAWFQRPHGGGQGRVRHHRCGHQEGPQIRLQQVQRKVRHPILSLSLSRSLARTPARVSSVQFRPPPPLAQGSVHQKADAAATFFPSRGGHPQGLVGPVREQGRDLRQRGRSGHDGGVL